MANKPCFGLMKCPYCKNLNAVFWNGNRRWHCRVCDRNFMVKRQKLTHIQPYIGTPPKERP